MCFGFLKIYKNYLKYSKNNKIFFKKDIIYKMTHQVSVNLVIPAVNHVIMAKQTISVVAAPIIYIYIITANVWLVVHEVLLQATQPCNVNIVMVVAQHVLVQCKINAVILVAHLVLAQWILNAWSVHLVLISTMVKIPILTVFPIVNFYFFIFTFILW